MEFDPTRCQAHEMRLAAVEQSNTTVMTQLLDKQDRLLELVGTLADRGIAAAQSASTTVAGQSSQVLTLWSPKAILGALVALLTAVLAYLLGKGGTP